MALWDDLCDILLALGQWGIDLLGLGLLLALLALGAPPRSASAPVAPAPIPCHSDCILTEVLAARS